MTFFGKRSGSKKRGRGHGSLSFGSGSRTPTALPAGQGAGPVPGPHHSSHNDNNNSIDNNGGSSSPLDGLDTVRKFVAARMTTKCHKCNAQIMPPASKFKVKTWMKRWSEASHDRPENANLLCVAECRGCRAMTCLGCGREPKESSAAAAQHVQGHYIAWCCRDGRLFAIWATLARFDQVELWTLSGGSSDSHSGAHGRSMSVSGFMPGGKRSKGTGYGTSTPFGGPLTGMDVDGFGLPEGRINGPLEFESSDARTDEFTQLVLELVTVMVPTKNNRNLLPELRGMLQLGYIIDKVADLLRNDSLDDVLKRAGLYCAILKLVHKLAVHPELSALVQAERDYKQRSTGLEAFTLSSSSSFSGHGDVGLVLGDTIPSVAERLKQLAKQSDVVLGTAECDDLTSKSGKALVELCHKIDDVYAEIATEEGQPQKNRQQQPGGGRTDAKASAEERWTAYHQKHSVTRSDAIVDPRLFLFYNAAVTLSYSHPGRMKRMVTELASMATSLPLGIFVKVGESRPDVMKCLIMGPPDSPYGYGLFEFDLYCPDQYPNVPPKVMSPTAIGKRLNPNLKPDGTVCLSLLGTYPGDAAAQWQPGKSTILSVLTSIQAMIFCEDPFRNEPAFGNSTGSTVDRHAQIYITQVQYDTIKFGIMEWIQTPWKCNGLWGKVIRAHFAINRDRILGNVDKWSRSNKPLRNMGAVKMVWRALDSLQSDG